MRRYLSRSQYLYTGNVVIGGWCADYPDPENFLDVLFHTGGNFNSANFSNPEVDKLLEEARTELDPAKRIALYQQVETMVLNQYAFIPMDYGIDGVLVSRASRIMSFPPSAGRSCNC